MKPITFSGGTFQPREHFPINSSTTGGFGARPVMWAPAIGVTTVFE